MLDVYHASVENVRELKKQIRVLNRLVNAAIRRGNNTELDTFTKIYALVYSAYAEVMFVKIVNTPHGFSDDYIHQFEEEKTIEDKWRKCIDLAFAQIETANNKGEIANKKKVVIDLLEEYIIEPSRIRNKIAHGQWKRALNNKCSAVNADTTRELEQLDFVTIDRYFNIYGFFSECIEDLIESPYRAHYRFFYDRLDNLQNYIEKTKNYTLESKRNKILTSAKHVHQVERQSRSAEK